MIAVFSGVAGSALSYYVGTRVLGFSPRTVLMEILVANLAVFACLPGTLYAQRARWLKPVMRGWLPSWVVLSSIWFAVILGFSPELRDVRRMAFMFFPLVMTTGFTILAYGPIHDGFFRRAQLRDRARQAGVQPASSPEAVKGLPAGEPSHS